MKRCKIQIDPAGLILFFIIMVPNFIWFAVPSPNDVLRTASAAPVLDRLASVFQVLMVVTLCLLRNPSAPAFRFQSGKIRLCCLSTALYLAAWAAYSQGLAGKTILLSLCLFPCASFFFLEAERKNSPAMIPMAVFSLLHLISSVINFL